MIFNYSRHAVSRMAQRKIDAQEVEAAILGGTIIKHYPEDTPYPSSLVIGVSAIGVLHVVYSKYESAAEVEYLVITVYRPDSKDWDEAFTTRRKRS